MKPSYLEFSQPSWRISSPVVSAFITEVGGHLGPVTFQIAGRKIQPFAIAPWHAEKIAGIPPMLEVLRGDFFCLPFGGNDRSFRGEHHPPHGETANARWRCVAKTDAHVHLRLNTTIRSGLVDKHVFLRPGQTAVYQTHVISGMSGPMSFGHHATLHFPNREGCGLISTSPFAWGEVSPRSLENPRERGYSCLRPGAKFRSLKVVPTADGGFADLSTYPARRGFEDLVMLVGRARAEFAWTAVSIPSERYVWFALKDPRVLSNTVLWLSNGGRHYAPWSGRHINVLGLEEVTSYFHYGLAESVDENPLNARGALTCRSFRKSCPLVVNYIMAVAPIPRGFDHVEEIAPTVDTQTVRLTSRSGRSVLASVDVSLLNQPPPFFDESSSPTTHATRSG